MSEIDIRIENLPAGVTYEIQPFLGGVKVAIRFPNDQGLSVIRHRGSYGGRQGLWEAMPVVFTGEGFNHWEIIGEPEGWLTPSDVDEIAQSVARRTKGLLYDLTSE